MTTRLLVPLGVCAAVLAGCGVAKAPVRSAPASATQSAAGRSVSPPTTSEPPVEINPSQGGNLLPAGTIVNGHVTRPIILDGGTLRIEPSPSALSPTVTLQQADSVVKAAQTYTPGTLDPADVGLGIVDLAASVSGGLPPYSNRFAWVAILGPQSQVAISCPGVTGGNSGPATPSAQVVLIDARTGADVLDYRSRGNGPCGGPITGPSVQRAQEVISIPWTGVGETPVSKQQLHQLFPPTANVPDRDVNWVIRYTVPRCATVRDSGVYDRTGPSQPILYVEVHVPISPPAACTPSKTVTQDFGPETVPISQAQHAPTGTRSL